MGLFNRKPGLSKTFRFTTGKTGTEWTYGIMVKYDTAAYYSRGTVRESAYEILTLGGGKVERIHETAVPRRVYRALANHMGAPTAEQMLGPAPDDVLDARWELIQRGDPEAAAKLIGEVGVSNSALSDEERAAHDDMMADTLRGEASGSLIAASSRTAGDVHDDGEADKAVQDPVQNADAYGETKRCPDCAESVLSAARKCRYCGYRFAPPIDDPA